MPVTCNPSYRNSVRVRKHSPRGWRAGTAVPLAREAQAPEEARPSERGHDFQTQPSNGTFLGARGKRHQTLQTCCVNVRLTWKWVTDKRHAERGRPQSLIPREISSRSWFSNQLPSIQRKKEFKDITEVCNNTLGDRCSYKSLRANLVPGWATRGTQLTGKHPTVPWKGADTGEVLPVFTA